MARTKGTFGISANIETNASAPLDARERVATKADLTASASFPYFYEGMQVYVVSEQKRYTLKGNDPTVLANWVEDVSGANKADLVDGKVPSSQLPSYVDDVIEGYYNTTDEKFYEESTYETEITGERGKIYIDLGTNPSDSYRWTGSEFAKVSSGGECNETILLADFEVLPTSEKNNGTAYFVPDANVVSGFTVMGNRFDKANIYTTDERMIGSWMGKPLYQKTIDCGTMSSATKDVAHNISNLGQVVDLYGVYTISANEILPIPYASHAGYEWQFRLSATSTQIVLTTGTGLTLNGTVYVTIRYTKTTDATVSIGTGNDYSTDEQIIGTWIDGKPIYQKTVTGLSVSLSSNWTDIMVNDINIDNIIDSRCLTSVTGTSAHIDSVWVKLESNKVQASNTNGGLLTTLILQYTKTTD